MSAADDERRRAALDLLQDLAHESRHSGLPPGFPRRWPACLQAMRAIAQHLHSLGADAVEIGAALRRDFPDMPDMPDVPVPAGEQEPPADPRLRRPAATWRRDAWWESLAHQEIARIVRHPVLRQRPDPEGQGDGADMPDAHWRGPADHEIALVSCARDLLQLCGFYDILIGVGEDGRSLCLSRPIPAEGPLRDAIVAYKPALLDALRPVGTVGAGDAL